MTFQDEQYLKDRIKDVYNSCEGTTWETESMGKIKNLLTQKMNLRPILVDKLIKEAIA